MWFYSCVHSQGDVRSQGRFLCKRSQLKLSKSCCWVWEHVLGDETSLVRRSLFLLGDLMKYWRTHPREICQKFSDLSQFLPYFIFPPGPNYYIYLLLLLLLIYYTSPTYFCTAITCLCLLGNVSLTLHSTRFISFEQLSSLQGWHFNYLTDLQVSTVMWIRVFVSSQMNAPGS